jgi:hypothetical protein
MRRRLGLALICRNNEPVPLNAAGGPARSGGRESRFTASPKHEPALTSCLAAFSNRKIAHAFAENALGLEFKRLL